MSDSLQIMPCHSGLQDERTYGQALATQGLAGRPTYKTSQWQLMVAACPCVLAPMPCLALQCHNVCIHLACLVQAATDYRFSDKNLCADTHA